MTPATPSKPHTLFDQQIVRNTFNALIEPGAVFEIRALGAKLKGGYREGIVSGYFEDPDKALLALENIVRAKGIYVTLNPVQGALLARRCNRLDYAGKDETTADACITNRRWLLIDVDPERLAGISATNAEKEHAHGSIVRGVFDRPVQDACLRRVARTTWIRNENHGAGVRFPDRPTTGGAARCVLRLQFLAGPPGSRDGAIRFRRRMRSRWHACGL